MKQLERDHSVEIKKRTSPLPSRTEVHKQKKKKTKFKLKYPVIRLLALLFILLPVAILSYKFNSNPEQVESTPVKLSANFESISYETEDEVKQSTIDDEGEPDPVKKDPEPSSEQGEETEPVGDNQAEAPSQVETKQDVEESSPPIKAVKQPESKQEQPKDSYDIKYHKVQAGENLFRISMKYYNSRSGEELIKEWNNLDGNTVVEGQVLRIPVRVK